MLKLLAALLLCTALNAAGLKVICLGDSHSTVEAGMGQALSKAAHQPVSYESIGVNGAKVQDLLKSLTTHQPPSGQGFNISPTQTLCSWPSELMMR
jgi:hypothetical protein